MSIEHIAMTATIITKSMRIIQLYVHRSYNYVLCGFLTSFFSQRLPFQLCHFNEANWLESQRRPKALNFTISMQNFKHWFEMCLYLINLFVSRNRLWNTQNKRIETQRPIKRLKFTTSFVDYFSAYPITFLVFELNGYVVRYFGLDVRLCSSILRQQWSMHTNTHMKRNAILRTYRMCIDFSK